MSARSSRAWSPEEIPGALGSLVSCWSGSWRILARRRRLEIARTFLGPLPVESFLEALEDSGRGDEAPKEKGPGRTGRPGRSGAPARAPKGRAAVLEVDCGDGSTLVVKALRRGGLPARLGGRFHGGSRLLSEMAILEQAIERGVPAAPLAFGALGRLREGGEVPILATESVPGAARLGDLIACEEGGPTEGRIESRRGALRLSGAAVCRAHDLGLDHADLNIGNILVAEGKEGSGRRAVIIDLGLSVLGDPLDPGRRAANLIRLLRSAEKHLGRDPRRLRDAAAFLHGYLSTRPDPRRLRRRELLAALRRRMPAVALHRLGWALLGRS